MRRIPRVNSDVADHASDGVRECVVGTARRNSDTVCRPAHLIDGSRQTEPKLASLAILPATYRGRRAALVVTAFRVLACGATLPFAKLPMVEMPAFVPAYQSALGINDLITSILLVGQVYHLRSRALLVLALGYVFTTFMVIVNMRLAFQEHFRLLDCLVADRRYGMALYVLARRFSDLRDNLCGAHGAPWTSRSVRPYLPRNLRRGHPRCCRRRVIAAGLTVLATGDRSVLPDLLVGNVYSSGMKWVIGTVWVVVWVAFACLWCRRPSSELDMWLMVVMCAWLCDIALGCVFNAGRYDLGFYAGRLYGLVASSSVLIVLLLGDALRFTGGWRSQTHRSRTTPASLEVRVQERTMALERSNTDLEQFAHVAAHDLRAPLRAIGHLAEWITDDVATTASAETGENLKLLRARVARMGMLLDGLLAYARVGRDQLVAEAVDTGAMVRDIVALLLALPTGSVVVCEGSMPVIRTHRVPLERVLQNLIDNGLKHHDGAKATFQSRRALTQAWRNSVSATMAWHRTRSPASAFLPYLRHWRTGTM